MDADNKDLAREALDGFFRRRADAGKFYCSLCLVARLKRTFLAVTAQAAVAEAFERPGALRVKPSGPCAICKKRRRCIGAPRLGP